MVYRHKFGLRRQQRIDSSIARERSRIHQVKISDVAIDVQELSHIPGCFDSAQEAGVYHPPTCRVFSGENYKTVKVIRTEDTLARSALSSTDSTG